MDAHREIWIPTMPNIYPPAERDYPISKRENILRALNHEKPAYMPNLMDCVRMIPPFGYGDMPSDVTRDGADWFGTKYKYSAAQGTSTPIAGMFREIGEWRERVRWPDYDAWDFKKGAEDFKKDENLATAAWFTNGIFERLHIFEGFEQALMDLLLEPEECRAFFMRMAEHKTEMFYRLHEIYALDYIIYNDDWGTQRGPFFSEDIVRELLLEPTAAFVKAVRDTGTKVIFHNCGLVDRFIPFFVEDIHADGLEIQHINDIKKILREYGDRVTSEYQMDLRKLYDPAVTPKQARALARDIVDTYGARTNPGAGVMLLGSALKKEVWYAFEGEIYDYSLKQYKGL